MKKTRVLVVSSANMDFVMDAGVMPHAGETVINDGVYKYVPGGKGANSAVAAARLGAICTFCTSLGLDVNGDSLLSLYNKEGINVSHITRTADYPTGLAAIMVGGDGNNRIIVYPGANRHIPEASIVSALDEMPDALFMQLETSPETVVFAANQASKRNIPVFIDAGPADPSFPLERLPRLEVFSPNESETAVFTGIKPKTDEDCLAAAKLLSARVKSHYYVIKLGGRGCFVTDLETSRTIPTFDGPVVDTTAAGDSFTAALTLEYIRCGNLFSAVRYANAVGTIVVGRAGASTSIPTSDEVSEFLRCR